MDSGLIVIAILVCVWALINIVAIVFGIGYELAERDYRRRLEEMLDRYKPHAPTPEIRGFKYQVRKEFGLEHTADELRRPYF